MSSGDRVRRVMDASSGRATTAPDVIAKAPGAAGAAPGAEVISSEGEDDQPTVVPGSAAISVRSVASARAPISVAPSERSVRSVRSAASESSRLLQEVGVLSAALAKSEEESQALRTRSTALGETAVEPQMMHPRVTTPRRGDAVPCDASFEPPAKALRRPGPTPPEPPDVESAIRDASGQLVEASASSGLVVGGTDEALGSSSYAHRIAIASPRPNGASAPASDRSRSDRGVAVQSNVVVEQTQANTISIEAVAAAQQAVTRVTEQACSEVLAERARLSRLELDANVAVVSARAQNSELRDEANTQIAAEQGNTLRITAQAEAWARQVAQ